jgi:hypothetical protein
VFEQAWDHALGITPIRSRPSHLDDHIYGPYVQPFEYTFKTKPSELVAEAKRRLMAEAVAACGNLQPLESDRQNLPKGKARQDREPITRRYAGWLYVHLVHKKEVADIARVFHTERGQNHKRVYRLCSCRPNVDKGLKQAQRLLNLTPYHLEEIIT